MLTHRHVVESYQRTEYQQRFCLIQTKVLIHLDLKLKQNILNWLKKRNIQNISTSKKVLSACVEIVKKSPRTSSQCGYILYNYKVERNIQLGR